MEDEILLRALLIEPLEEAGFTVIEAPSAKEAYEVLDREGGVIRTVITDVNLGTETTGWHVGHHARKVSPHMPVIYTTSYSVEEWSAHGVPESIHIVKPFAAVQVVTALSQLLNTSGARL